MIRRAMALATTVLALAAPAGARDSLGMFDNWGAFRDPAVPRCYAIARADHSARSGTQVAYADVASWPRRKLRSEVHFHLSRPLLPGKPITLTLGDQHIALVGGGAEAWVADPRMTSAIIAAMRYRPSMSIVAHDIANRRFVETWQLAGAGSAMDSAAVGCAELR